MLPIVRARVLSSRAAETLHKRLLQTNLRSKELRLWWLSTAAAIVFPAFIRCGICSSRGRRSIPNAVLAARRRRELPVVRRMKSSGSFIKAGFTLRYHRFIGSPRARACCLPFVRLLTGISCAARYWHATVDVPDARCCFNETMPEENRSAVSNRLRPPSEFTFRARTQNHPCAVAFSLPRRRCQGDIVQRTTQQPIHC